MQFTGFEQMTVGQTIQSPSLRVTAEEIKAFANQFDFQPQHTDEALARGTMFGTLVASGWHTAALTMRLLLLSGLSGVGGRSLGMRIDGMTWSLPVYPDDELHIISEVLELRPSRSKPDRGIAVVKTQTFNQDGKMVQELTSTLLILRSDAVITPGG